MWKIRYHNLEGGIISLIGISDNTEQPIERRGGFLQRFNDLLREDAAIAQAIECTKCEHDCGDIDIKNCPYLDHDLKQRIFALQKGHKVLLEDMDRVLER